MSWQATILTLFPEMFPGPLGTSLAGKALEAGAWSIVVRDIRASATDRRDNRKSLSVVVSASIAATSGPTTIVTPVRLP